MTLEMNFPEKRFCISIGIGSFQVDLSRHCPEGPQISCKYDHLLIFIRVVVHEISIRDISWKIMSFICLWESNFVISIVIRTTNHSLLSYFAKTSTEIRKSWISACLHFLKIQVNNNPNHNA